MRRAKTIESELLEGAGVFRLRQTSFVWLRRDGARQGRLEAWVPFIRLNPTESDRSIFLRAARAIMDANPGNQSSLGLVGLGWAWLDQKVFKKSDAGRANKIKPI